LSDDALAHRTGVHADQRLDCAVADQLLDLRLERVRFVARVDHREVDAAPAHAARGVPLLGSERCAGQARRSPDAGGAGHRDQHADTVLVDVELDVVDAARERAGSPAARCRAFAPADLESGTRQPLMPHRRSMEETWLYRNPARRNTPGYPGTMPCCS